MMIKHFGLDPDKDVKWVAAGSGEGRYIRMQLSFRARHCRYHNRLSNTEKGYSSLPKVWFLPREEAPTRPGYQRDRRTDCRSKKEILNLAFAFDEDGRLPYDTVIYSCPKKSGKTTLNAALTLWWALTQEAPNEILIVANDLEQSLARAYRTMESIIEHNPELKAECKVQTKIIYLENGSIITAISADYQGASGSNHGWVSYEEICAVSSENGRRLFEELTSVPTRKNSVNPSFSTRGVRAEKSE